MWLGDNKTLTMPAGRVLVVIVVALAVAALLNSEAVVRAGDGMDDGPTRDVVLALGRPIDDDWHGNARSGKAGGPRLAVSSARAAPDLIAPRPTTFARVRRKVAPRGHGSN